MRVGQFPPMVEAAGHVFVSSGPWLPVATVTLVPACNYASAELAAILERGHPVARQRTGICFDNALAESLNAAVETGPGP